MAPGATEQRTCLNEHAPGLGAKLGFEKLPHVLRVALHGTTNVCEIGPQCLLGANAHQHRRLHGRALLFRQFRVLVFGEQVAKRFVHAHKYKFRRGEACVSI